jgi:hypothetical protein
LLAVDEPGVGDVLAELDPADDADPAGTADFAATRRSAAALSAGS